MPKRRADDAPEPKDPEEAGHAGEMMQGYISQLTDKAYEEGQARPRNYQDTGIGFRLWKARSSADRVRKRKRK
jgi:hypothetical protein